MLDDLVTPKRRKTDMPMPLLLGNIHAEIDALAEVGDGLQALAGRLLTRAGGVTDAAAIEDAQGLDALVQRLRGLASFFEALIPTVSPQWRLDPRGAAAAVSLSSLRHRLSPDGDEDGEPKAEIDSGDCELF